jgi:hypothetical protein
MIIKDGDFNDLIYGRRPQWSDELQLLTWHATTLRILYVSVVYQLDMEWCPPSLGMTIFVVMLLVRMMHE